MKSFLRFFIPVLIFSVTLVILLRFNGQIDYNRGGAVQDWTLIKEGNPKLYPELDDLFQFPEAVAKLDLIHEGKVISTTTYEVNSFGLRDREAEPKKKSHFILAGCSYIFGHGVNAEDMISSKLGKLEPQVNVRHIGFPGGGLHTTLRYLDIVDPRLWAPEEEGHFVFVSIDDHFARYLHDPAFLMWAPETAPYFVRREGKVVYGGKMKELSEYQVMQSLKDLGLGGLYAKFLPEPYTDEKIEFFMDSVVELKRRYLEKYPKGEFTWIIHPLSGVNHLYGERVRTLAARKGITLVELHPVMRWLYQEKHARPDEQYLKHDNHPSPVNNEFFARWLQWHFFSERAVKGRDSKLLLKGGRRLPEASVSEKPAIKKAKGRKEHKVK